MTPEELDRLYDSLRRLESHWETTHKEIMACRNDLNIHLETSIIRVKGYDEFDQVVKSTMKSLDERIKILEDYVKDAKSKKEGIQEGKKTVGEIASTIRWLLAVGGMIFAWWATRK